MNLLNRFVRSLHRWWLSRQWKLLIPALPAVIVGVVSLGFIGFALAEGNRQITARYLEEAKKRFEAGDHHGALTCYERLAHQAIERQDVHFGLARAAEACGYQERAVVLMRELAPPGERGYPEAHLWWARHLLRFGKPTKENYDLIERHLLNAIDGRTSDSETAHGLLGELYVNRGQLQQAELHLKKSVSQNPQLHLRLAQLYLSKGELQQGRNAAESAARFFQLWIDNDLYARQGRLGMADARVLLGDFDGAIAVLKEGLNVTGDVEYRRATSRIYLAWTQHLNKTKPNSIGEQLDLIEKALSNDPDNPELVLRIWAMSSTKGKDAEQAFAVLRKQLSSGKATALTHLALGMRAWEEKKQAEALVHLEQAYKLAPQMALVANNLAWVLANSRPPNTKRALALINTVLERFPNEPMFRDTRAYVHFLEGNWKEALNDYQAALPAYAHQPDIHKKLSTVYDKLGLKEMAKEHAARAEEILEKARQSRPKK